MRRVRALAAGLALPLALLAGCGSTPRVSVEVFQVPPRGWQHVGLPDSPSPVPAQLEVRGGRLVLSGSQAVLAPTALRKFRGHVDMAIVDGDRRGFAGILLVSPDGRYDVLAVRPSGEWRYYRSTASPLSPVGGRGWQRSERESATGYWRLGVQADDHELSFEVDGSPVQAVSIPPEMAEAVREGGWRIGLLTQRLECHWKNFLFGEDGDRPFGPIAYENWGASELGAQHLAELRELTKSFARAPSYMGVFAMAAAFDAARKIGEQENDQDLRTKAIRWGRQIAASSALRKAARRLGEESLLVRAFQSTASNREQRERILGLADRDLIGQAEQAESDGRLAEALLYYALALEVERDAKLRERLEKLKEGVADLHYRLDVDTSRVTQSDDQLVSPRDFTRVAHGVYGGLRSSSGADAELLIQLRVDRSHRDIEVRNDTRRVAVAAGGAMAPELENELDRLERSLPGELRDALASAEISRAAAQLLGRSTLDLRTFELGGKSYQLHPDEGKHLVQLFQRYAELRRRREKLGATLRYEDVKARLRTSSFLMAISFTVSYQGRTVVEVTGDRTYLGFEQWEHAAYPALGVKESRFTDEDLAEGEASVRRRVLGRFRTAISRENLVSKLDANQKLPFLLQVARTTRQRDASADLEWFLQKEYGLTGDLRRHVTERLLD